MEDARGYGTSQMPLAGTVLCCTSIPPEQRTELAAIGSQMGATIKLDLTSDVTHLIVGNINSAKYRYVAKSREDVKVLSPEWLEALRTVWMEGGDVDVAALEKEYRLPTFYGLKICLTGFDNPDQRKYIQETVIQHGAEYHGDLTKLVTHLIAAIPSGNKYEHAVGWRLKVISLEWFEQSLERGMALDELYYNPTIPLEERGKGAWDRGQTPSSILGKRRREAEANNVINRHKRTLRRSASSRMGSQSEALWAGITAGGLERQNDAQDDWTEDVATRDIIAKAGAPTLEPSCPTSAKDDAQPEDPASDTRRPSVLAPNRNNGIFEGRVICLCGFDEEKTTILHTHLENNGAAVFREVVELIGFSPDDLRRGYLVVPHDVIGNLQPLPEAAGHLNLVTNWWVERCLHAKVLVDHTENVLCRPFDKLRVSGFNDLTVNSTAFTGIELLHVTKVVTLMGATYDEFLSPKTSVMVCNTRKPNPEKLKFVTEKRIPAVHADWLWECLRTGELQPFDEYLLNVIVPGRTDKTSKISQQPFTEVPTAPLSSEDSTKLRKKKMQATKPVTQSRNGPQRPRTLDLALFTDSVPHSTESSTNPNRRTQDPTVDENEGFNGAFDGSASQPLQDINPSVNSPRRPSTSSIHSNLFLNSKSASTSRSNSTSDAPRKPAPLSCTRDHTPESMSNTAGSNLPLADEMRDEEHDYTNLMSGLLAARKAAASAAPSKEDEKKKRRRQLGRATSTRSNGSTAEEVFSRTSSADHTRDVRDGDENENRDRRQQKYVEYQPSQELGWDAEGLQAGIGVVKDVVSEGSKLGRRRRM